MMMGHPEPPGVMTGKSREKVNKCKAVKNSWISEDRINNGVISHVPRPRPWTPELKIFSKNKGVAASNTATPLHDRGPDFPQATPPRARQQYT
jgi:hypothetical protein